MVEMRCAGCGFLWDMPTDECVNCGRPAEFNRIPWEAKYGTPRSEQ